MAAWRRATLLFFHYSPVENLWREKKKEAKKNPPLLYIFPPFLYTSEEANTARKSDASWMPENNRLKERLAHPGR